MNRKYVAGGCQAAIGGSVGLGGLGMCLLGSGVVAWVGTQLLTDAPAVPYEPNCEDAACVAWAGFRAQRPFPFQTIVLLPLGANEVVVIASEPDSSVAQGSFRHLATSAFGSDLVKAEEYRWMTHVDGWLEDLVLTVRLPEGETLAGGLDAMPITRDRLAFLHEVHFGTTYGADPLALISGDAAPASIAGLDVDVSAAELSNWISDPSRRWIEVGSLDATAEAWDTISVRGRSGSFASDDGSLVLFMVPADRIRNARVDVSSLADLRDDFRRFAVASDIIVGATWDDSQVALVGRARREPLHRLPPLRFETFALLAAESDEQVSQSYDRTRMLAGKLDSGPDALRDWAPIYLSPSLIDTEFGTLLNITDQMLKSWSQAGEVEYLYFSYPLKPTRFPWPEPLSAALADAEGATSVLFNWNTSGVASVATLGNQKWLTAGRTGSLPVTYGSDLANRDQVETGHLLDYEKTGYDYFATLGDPNLARVVQYTLAYQAFHAAVPPAPRATIPSVERRPGTRAIETAVVQVLAELERRGEVPPAVIAFQERYDVPEGRTATLLSDPRIAADEIRARFTAMLVEDAALEPLRRDLEERQAAYSGLVREYNADVELLNRGAGSVALANSLSGRERTLNALRGGMERDAAPFVVLENRKAELNRDGEMIEELTEVERALRGATDALIWEHGVISAESTYRDFLAGNATVSSDSSIRTGSAVVSWNRSTVYFVGGHNVGAGAVQLIPDQRIASIEVRAPDGAGSPVILYNPAYESEVVANAGRLARSVEHEQVTSSAELSALLVQRADRDPQVALGGGGASPPPKKPRDPWAGGLGPRDYDDKGSYINNLRVLAENNSCCVLVARDNQGASYVVRANPSPPPTTVATMASDTPSLVAALAARPANGGPIIFLNHSEGQVKAIGQALGPAPLASDMAAYLGTSSRQPGDELIGAVQVPMADGYATLSLRAKPPAIAPGWREGLQATVARWAGYKPRWPSVRLQRLSPEDARQMAVNAGWTESDGLPHALVIMFDGANVVEPGSVSLLAGFDARYSAGDGTLRTAATQATASGAGKTVSEVLYDIRQRVMGSAGSSLRRFQAVIEGGGSRLYISRRLGDEILEPRVGRG